MKSRYFSPEELQRIVAETDDELDRRFFEERDAATLAQLERAMQDPTLRKEIDDHPVVKAIRARKNDWDRVRSNRDIPQRQQPGVPAATPPQRPTPPQPVQRIGFSSEARNPMVTSPKADGSRPKSRAELEAERPWLRPQPKSTTLIDPYVRRKNSI